MKKIFSFVMALSLVTNVHAVSPQRQIIKHDFSKNVYKEFKQHTTINVSADFQLLKSAQTDTIEAIVMGEWRDVIEDSSLVILTAENDSIHYSSAVYADNIIGTFTEEDSYGGGDYDKLILTRNGQNVLYIADHYTIVIENGTDELEGFQIATILFYGYNQVDRDDACCFRLVAGLEKFDPYKYDQTSNTSVIFTAKPEDVIITDNFEDDGVVLVDVVDPQQGARFEGAFVLDNLDSIYIVPLDVYDINDSEIAPSMIASAGYDGEVDYPTYLLMYISGYEYSWYIVDGSATMSANKLTVAGINSNGNKVDVTINFKLIQYLISTDTEHGKINGGGYYDHHSTAWLTAVADEHYHFVRWSDGNTDNPRSIVVTQDSSFIAEFAKNIYTFDVQTADSIMGNVTGIKGAYECKTILSVSAIPNCGYHFDHWSDGNKQSQRTISLTKNISLIAYFAKDIYSVTIPFLANGSVQGARNYDYLDSCTLVVTPNYGYQFTKWNDGNTDNPRSLVVTQDTTFIAQIDTAKSGQCGDNLYWELKGDTLIISGTGAMDDHIKFHSAEWYLSNSKITKLILDDGITYIGNYAFGNMQNITTLQLPNSIESIGSNAFSNTAITELVVPNNVKSIGVSAFANCSTLTSVVIPNSVETIGESAFANCAYLTDVVIGANVTDIGCNAFAGDFRLENIICYAPITPNVCSTTFSGINKFYVYLYVLESAQRKYQVDPNWSGFSLHLIGAEQKPITGDEVIVLPTSDNATFTWPANPSADGYSLEITKDGVVFCTLKFNAQGQLTGIAFAPSRGGQAREMASAEMTANGWQFTVTGLNQASKYGYTLDALNASQQSIKHYEGEFTTDGYTALDRLTDSPINRFTKIIKDNRLLIRHNGKLYNALGGKVR